MNDNQCTHRSQWSPSPQGAIISILERAPTQDHSMSNTTESTTVNDQSEMTGGKSSGISLTQLIPEPLSDRTDGSSDDQDFLDNLTTGHFDLKDRHVK